MFSKQILNDLITHCIQCCPNNDDTGETCTASPDCIYKAECDAVRYQYGCKPCNLNYDTERGNNENDTDY